MNPLLCPACRKPLSSLKAIPKHTNGCPQWKEVIGIPPSQFDFDRYFQRSLWAPEMVEGEDFIVCLLCVSQGIEIRVKRLIDHLKNTHKISKEEYRLQFPGSPFVVKSTNEKRKKTTQIRYGVDNVWQSDEIKEKIRKSSIEKYGVEHPRQAQEIQQKCVETNLKKYGVENVFAADEIKIKIRKTNLERYGVENPQQAPEIRYRTIQSTIEKYGTNCFLVSETWHSELVKQRDEKENLRRESLISSGNYEICLYCSNVFTKITSRHKVICEGWVSPPNPEPCLCGHKSVSLTSMKRHRKLCLVWQTRDAYAIYRARTVATLLKRYGTTLVSSIDGLKEKRIQTTLQKYGAGSVFSKTSSLYHTIQKSLVGKRPVLRGNKNPFSWVSVKEKILRKCLAKVGHDFPIYPSPASSLQELQERYGMISPMQDRDYVYYQLRLQNSSKFPNKLESTIQQINSKLYYTGNRNFWRWLPMLNRYKNPDFIVCGPDKEHPYRDVTQVVEVFGDFWHSERFTGKSPIEHENELIEAYAQVGLHCLVLWEGEIKKNFNEINNRLNSFLSKL